MSERWILDVDSSVKPIYGHQEGAEVGYNPMKPGRPSHVYHTYAMAEVRLVLDVEVMPGNEHHASYGLPGLLRMLKGMQPHERPDLVRGDAAYGSERVMADMEALDQDYLFKLRMTKKVQRQIAKLAAQRGWQRVGQGWEAAETELQLTGWTRKRRVVVLRRRIERDTSTLLGHVQPDKNAPALIEILSPDRKVYEYTALVTSTDAELLARFSHRASEPSSWGAVDGCGVIWRNAGAPDLCAAWALPGQFGSSVVDWRVTVARRARINGTIGRAPWQTPRRRGRPRPWRRGCAGR